MALDRATTGGWTYLWLASPMVDEDGPKDQDRAAVVGRDDIVGALVADGVTSSPRSAQGAEFVASLASELVSDNPEQFLEQAAIGLQALRAEAQTQPITVDPAIPEQMRSMVMQAATEKLRRSHQTTLVALRAQADANVLSIRLAQCGDSVFLAYSRQGKLLYSTAGVRRSATGDLGNARLEFVPGGSVTAVFPDHASETFLWQGAITVPLDSLLVLASDGVTGAFEGPSTLWEWFSWADSQGATAASADIHARLAARKGDDDVSLIVLWRDQTG